MKRCVPVLMIIPLLMSTLKAAPTVTAGSGLFRVQNASITKGALSFNLHLAGNPAGAYHMNDGNFSTWDGILRLGASWAPLEFLEVGLVPAIGYYKPRANDTADIGLWDMEVNAKASYSRMKVLKLGLQARVLVPLASDAFFPAGYSNGFDVGGRGLITADFRDVMKFPLLLHLNAGYMLSMDTYDSLMNEYNIAGYFGRNRMMLGAGLEIPTRFVTLLTELYTEPSSQQPGDIWLTPTLRLNLPFGFHVDYGMDFLILADTSDPRENFYHTITTGISWSTPPKKHIPMGSISGMVKDSEKGTGIVAKVSYSGAETGMIDAGSMGFKLDSLTPGTYTLEAIAEGYSSEKKSVAVLDGQVTEIDFALKPSLVTFSGTVHEREKDAPLAATIRFTDGSLPEVMTDPATGIFKVQVKPGTYGVEVTSEGYLPQTASIIVSKTGAVKDFKLIKKGMKIAFRGINFETAKAVILPESYPILDEAAKILLENPDINVEIGGHTDNRGSDVYNQKLSQERAESVRLYLIENHKIEGSRLFAKGYGESQPVAPNDTEENMAKNRRVEFTILK